MFTTRNRNVALLCFGVAAWAGGCGSSNQDPRGGAGGGQVSGGTSAGGASGALSGGASGDAGMSGGTAGAPPGGSGGTAGGAYAGPQLLSETGLYADIATRELAPGVVSYQVQYPLWSDGSVKTRYFALPDGAAIDTSDPDHWTFPIGATAWKQFERDGVLVETRIVRKTPVGFDAVAYVWRGDGSDAEVRPEGVEDASGTQHDVPSQAQCLECHQNTHDLFLGLSLVQLSTLGESELARFAAAGWLSNPQLQAFHAPGTPEQAAGLGYLHGNCGHCHRAEHALGDRLSLRLALDSTDTELAMTGFGVSTPNAPAKHVIAGTSVIVVPGQPAQSQLWVRSGLRGFEGMPPLGTERVSAPGQASIASLISSLP